MGAARIESLDRLVRELQKLPGIGARSAERLAFYLLRCPPEEAQSLAGAISHLRKVVRHCSRCFNLTECDPCVICSDARRNHKQIWVVEEPKDVLALEATGLVQRVYHVLMGHVAPLEGIGPEDLTLDALVQRVEAERPEELILATNPTIDGDSTALQLIGLLEPTEIKISRLARGLPVGSQIEYATTAMLEAAIKGRC